MELNEAARRIFGTHLRLIALWVILGFLVALCCTWGMNAHTRRRPGLVLDIAGRQRSLQTRPRSPTWPRPLR